ncbi:hypothetical protein PC114_g5252 [Phytophthora cactorum]|uniref:Uncharacterized protein n=1 Tax=Phytophthora cactorum TaxID=29920 RepID=A0A8T1DZ15_9STRA|nr:hypothetical protein PC114_g5252 [Phytophthora cactorum]KAG2946998.1 hypothetical protein PC117_g7179 [Phytophthora cactorum]
MSQSVRRESNSGMSTSFSPESMTTHSFCFVGMSNLTLRTGKGR